MKTAKPIPLGKAIATARKAKKLTLRQLAKKAKLSHQSVHRLEQGSGGLDTAVRVMRALDFTEVQVGKLLAAQVTNRVRAI